MPATREYHEFVTPSLDHSITFFTWFTVHYRLRLSSVFLSPVICLFVIYLTFNLTHGSKSMIPEKIPVFVFLRSM